MPRLRDEATELRAIPITGIPEILPGDSAAHAILKALAREKLKLVPGDILAKAEARRVVLDLVRPAPAARRWAARYRLDARVVHLALNQAKRVVRRNRGAW